MVWADISKIVLCALGWASFNEGLATIIPLPKKIAQMDDKEERTKAYNRYMACYVGGIQGVFSFTFSVINRLIYGFERNSTTEYGHYIILYVSSQ